MLERSAQSWNPAQYAQNARFVADLGMPVLELLAPQPGEHILDLGCGDGALTKKLLDFGCSVVGVDASTAMIDAARALGLDARVMDGEALNFTEEFDAVFSNAALHWMTQPEQVLAGVWRALKLGGRFVGEFGGYGNVATIVEALNTALHARGIAPVQPWFFPAAEHYQQLLEAAGFELGSIALIPRPTPLPGNVGSWLETFAHAFTNKLAEPERAGFIAEVVSALRSALCGEDGVWQADYVRLRFAARKRVKSQILTHTFQDNI